MARGRMLNRKVAVDPEVAKLVEKEGVEAGLFYTWLIPFLDKWGNCRADKWWMKGNVVPRIDDISAEDCGRFVESICELGLAQKYEVEGLPYLHFPGFLRNQKGLRTDREGTDVPTPREWPSDEPFRAGHWERLRQVYRYTCLGCGKKKPTISLSPDHVVPVRRGGPDTLENVQTLCESCNMKKADRIADFRPPSTLGTALDWVRSGATKDERPEVLPGDWKPGTLSDPPGEVEVHPAYRPPEESRGERDGLSAELEWTVSGSGVERGRKKDAPNRERAEVEVEVEVEGEVEGSVNGARDPETPDEARTQYTETSPPPGDLHKIGGDYVYPEWFERLWLEYPDRTPGSSKVECYRKCRARLRNGADTSDLEDAAGRYRAFCEADERIDTKYVKRAEVFYGPNEHWRDDWEVPDDNGNDGPSGGRDTGQDREKREFPDLSV